MEDNEHKTLREPQHTTYHIRQGSTVHTPYRSSISTSCNNLKYFLADIGISACIADTDSRQGHHTKTSTWRLKRPCLTGQDYLHLLPQHGLDQLDHLDPDLPFWYVVQDLYSTDPTQETCPGLGGLYCCSHPRQHDIVDHTRSGILHLFWKI